MKARRCVQIAVCVTALLAFGVAAAGQEHSASKGKETSEQMGMPILKPGPEHAHLAKLTGKWKTVQEMSMQPGQPPMKTEGVSETRSICHGLWFTTTYKAGEFEGHGLDGWDTTKKKYVGTWVDNMGPSINTYEGDVDASGKVFTATMTGADMSGKMATYTMREEWKDDNTRDWKMYMGASAEGEPMIHIVYTRIASTKTMTKR